MTSTAFSRVWSSDHGDESPSAVGLSRPRRPHSRLWSVPEGCPGCLARGRLQADRGVCGAAQGVALRVATFAVLRYGSTLSKVSVHRFFTLCWMRVSAACARWRSLRGAAWGGAAPSTALEAQQPLLQPS